MTTKEIQEKLKDSQDLALHLDERIAALEDQRQIISNLEIPDYSADLSQIDNLIISLMQANEQIAEQLRQLNLLIERKDQPILRHIRILLFPEINQKEYYKIVFGRLLAWGFGLFLATYGYFLADKAIVAWGNVRYNKESEQCVKAWLYMSDHANKHVKKAMDEAWVKSTGKEEK